VTGTWCSAAIARYSVAMTIVSSHASVSSREFHLPDRRRSERRGTLKRVPSIKLWNGKPERFALAFRCVGVSVDLRLLPR
jgi:hypothetical protein